MPRIEVEASLRAQFGVPLHSKISVGPSPPTLRTSLILPLSLFTLYSFELRFAVCPCASHFDNVECIVGNGRNSMPSQNRRQPRKRTKTFTGCWTCRTRKIKCDESKPCCHQCFEKGLSCEGYTARLQWLTPVTGRNDHRANESQGLPLDQNTRRLIPVGE